LSKKEALKKEKKSETKCSEKKKSSAITPSDRDHYAYASIIAEIGY